MKILTFGRRFSSGTSRNYEGSSRFGERFYPRLFTSKFCWAADEFCTYIDYIADRLNGVGLEVLHPGLENPFPWLAEMMDVKKEQNFFEGRVTEYQKSSALSEVSDDEL